MPWDNGLSPAFPDGSAGPAGKASLVAGIQVITNKQGPLPVSAMFATQGTTMIIQASGSAYGSPSGTLRVSVLVDNVLVGTLYQYVNEASSHRALVPSVREGSR